MQKILVTGAEGFTGRYVCSALHAAGFEVFRAALVSPHQDSHICDLTDPGAVSALVESERPDGLIHLAGLSFAALSGDARYIAVNVDATLNLLRAMSRWGTGKGNLILASSASIYGLPQTPLLTEESPPAPHNDYARSKWMMEQRARDEFSDLNVVIVRPFNYTGIGQEPHFLIPKIVHHFSRRAPVIELGNLDISRDFSDVRDVAQIYARLAALPAPSGPLNICSGRTHSLREIFDLCAHITGYAPQITVNPEFVRATDPAILRASDAALMAHIGPLPRRPIEETLRWMCGASAPV